MASKRVEDQIGTTSAPSLQVAGLGEAELLRMQAAMSEIAPEWLAELHNGSSDEPALLLVPDGGDDAIGPSFLVSQEAFGFRVDQLHWDKLTEIGVFSSLNDVLFTLRARLAFCSGGTVPTSMAVH